MGHPSWLQVLCGDGLGVIQISCENGRGRPQVLGGDGLGVIQISCGDGCGTPISTPGVGWKWSWGHPNLVWGWAWGTDLLQVLGGDDLWGHPNLVWRWAWDTDLETPGFGWRWSWGHPNLVRRWAWDTYPGSKFCAGMVLGSSKSRVKMGGDDPRFWVGMVLGSSKSRVGMGVGHRSRLQVLGGNGLGVIQISCGDGLGAPISSRFWVEMIFGVIQISCGDGRGTPISRLQVLGGGGLGVIQISCGDGRGAPISTPNFGWKWSWGHPNLVWGWPRDTSDFVW